MGYRGHVKKGVVVFDEPVSLPDGTDVSVEPLGFPDGGFWKCTSLADLIRAQGVQPLSTDDDMSGGWPLDELDDGFQEALLQWRAESPEPAE